MKHAALILLAACCGFGMGLLFGSGTCNTEATLHSNPLTHRIGVGAAKKSDEGALLHIIQAQRSDIDRLLKELGRSTSANQTVNESKDMIAAHTLLTYRRFGGNSIGSEREHKRALGLLGALDEEMAPYFIEQYKQSLLSGNPDGTALSLALSCGGKVVGEFITNRFSDINATRMELNNLCRAISGIDGWMTITEGYEFSDHMRDTAVRLVRSEDALDRRGGAGLLGCSTSRESEDMLRTLATNDPDPYVRGSALRSLGKMGSQGTVEFLKQSAAHVESLPANAETLKLRDILRVSIEECYRRGLSD